MKWSDVCIIEFSKYLATIVTILRSKNRPVQQGHPWRKWQSLEVRESGEQTAGGQTFCRCKYLVRVGFPIPCSVDGTWHWSALGPMDMSTCLWMGQSVHPRRQWQMGNGYKAQERERKDGLSRQKMGSLPTFYLSSFNSLELRTRFSGLSLGSGHL
jgi:hypothetical protein